MIENLKYRCTQENKPSPSFVRFNLFLAVMLWLCLSMANAQDVTPTTDKTNADSINLDSGKIAPPLVCMKISELLKNKEIEKYYFPSVTISDMPRSKRYVDLDFDGDEVSDKVIISSGSAGSFLLVELSGGGRVELEDGFMRLIRFNKEVYILATDWKTNTGEYKFHGRRLFHVSKSGIKKICDYKDL